MKTGNVLVKGKKVRREPRIYGEIGRHLANYLHLY
jgi:hypothetical protein